MPFSLTLDQIQALNPCEHDGERVVAALTATGATEWTAAEARAAGCTLKDIIWAATVMARTDREIERRLCHWTADCVARVLHIYERQYPDDVRVRAAIEAASDASAAAGAAERAWQFGRLCEWLSDTPPEPLLLPEKE